MRVSSDGRRAERPQRGEIRAVQLHSRYRMRREWEPVQCGRRKGVQERERPAGRGSKRAREAAAHVVADQIARMVRRLEHDQPLRLVLGDERGQRRRQPVDGRQALQHGRLTGHAGAVRPVGRLEHEAGPVLGRDDEDAVQPRRVGDAEPAVHDRPRAEQLPVEEVPGDVRGGEHAPILPVIQASCKRRVGAGVKSRADTVAYAVRGVADGGRPVGAARSRHVQPRVQGGCDLAQRAVGVAHRAGALERLQRGATRGSGRPHAERRDGRQRRVIGRAPTTGATEGAPDSARRDGGMDHGRSSWWRWTRTIPRGAYGAVTER